MDIRDTQDFLVNTCWSLLKVCSKLSRQLFGIVAQNWVLNLFLMTTEFQAVVYTVQSKQ